VSTTDKPACADGNEVAAQTKIDLMENYNPDSGTITGPMGGLPIQTPVSPDGKFVIQANTLTATITIIDTKTNDLVKSLVCEAGCHGGNFGAKKGGGYYLYVSNKFSDTMDVVDLDPDGDGDAKDAKIVGRLLTDAEPGTMIDDAVSAYPGQGGQGVLPLPNVNNGWVQNLPPEETVGLTKEQLNPLGTKATARCGRRVTIKADGGSGPRLRKVMRVTMAGRKLKTTRKAGRTLAVVDLSKRTSGVAVIRITGKTTMGRTVTRVRKISACATRR
jgi:DNA-binding beta-propeller fold protein YncE